MATFTNRAFLTYNNITTGSNIATGEILETLSAVKIAVIGEYRQGDCLTYVVSIVNSGPTALTGLTLTDDLGAYTLDTATLYPLTYTEDSLKYFVNGILQPTPTVTAENNLSVTPISIPAGGNAIIVYSVTANAFAPLGEEETIVSTATVSGAGLPSSVTAEETVTTASAPELTITKSISPSTVTENSRVTYTFVIQNYGSRDAVATDNAVVSDTFDPILKDLAVSFNGTAWQEETEYSYNAETGLFTTVAGQITVPAATYTRDPETGAVIVDPGTAVLTVVGTI